MTFVSARQTEPFSSDSISGKTYIFVLFAVIFAGRIWLIGSTGSDIPFFDQWDGEALRIYRAWQMGTLTWADLLQAHNEHRILATHLLNLGLLELNGQWDPLVQMIAGALIHAATGAFLGGWLTKGLGKGHRVVMGVAVVALFSPIAGWHNAIWGFQSQVFIVIGASVVAMWGLGEYNDRSRCLILGIVSAIVALASSATAIFLGVALMGFAIEGSIAQRRLHRGACMAFASGALVVLLASVLRPTVSGHTGLRAENWTEFVVAWTSALAWPETRLPSLSFVVMNLPWLGLVAGRITGRLPKTPSGDRAVLIAGFSIAASAGQAWARGGAQLVASGIPSRYVDFLLFLPLANILAVCELQRMHAIFFRRKWNAAVLAGVWFVMASAWVVTSIAVWETIILPRKQDRHLLARITGTVLSARDGAILKGRPWISVPHFDAEPLLKVTDDEVLRPILSPSLQVPVSLKWPDGDTGLLQLGAFPGSIPATGRFPAWGNFGAGSGPSRVGQVESEPFVVQGYAQEISLLHTGARLGTFVSFIERESKKEIRVNWASIPPGVWENLAIRVPPGVYSLRFNNDDPRVGVALTASRPMGPLSWFARRLFAVRGELLWLSAGGFFVVMVVSSISGQRFAQGAEH